MRRRGETVERSFAHIYDTGGMRRRHLRGHTNILKRILIHATPSRRLTTNSRPTGSSFAFLVSTHRLTDMAV